MSSASPVAPGLPLPAAVPPAGRALRLAGGTAGVGAIAATAAAGTAPLVIGLLLVVLQVAATAVGVLGAVPRSARRAASWAVLGLALVGAATGSGGGTDRLTVVAGALVVAQTLLLERRRDVGVGLVTVAGASVLVLSLQPPAAAVVALVLAWSAGVVTTALLRRPVVGAVVGPVVGPGAGPGVGPVVGAGAAGPGTPAVLGAAVRRVAWPLAASLVAAAVVTLLGVTPPATGPRASDGAGGFGEPSGTDVPERMPADVQSAGMDLNERGDLPDWPVMEVPAGSDRLWRTGVLGSSTGSVWWPVGLSPDPATASDADPLALGDVDPGADPRGAVRTDRVVVRDGLWGGLAVPGHAVALRAEVPLLPAAQVGELSLAGRSSAYEVDSLAVPDAAAVGPGTGADPADPVWTELPPGVTQRTRDLAEEVTRGARTRSEVVAAVEQHLRGSYAYDLRSPVPPGGQDPVDHFLFGARSGFCQQFATAEVVMLRSLGVPARIAVGYSGGTTTGDRRLVTADRSHAWVEVWQPGTGWAPSDPTPAATEPGLRDRVTAWFADAGNRRLLAVALLVAFAAAGAVAVLRRRRSRPGPVPVQAPDPLLDAAERLLPALAAAGRPSEPHETVGALARREPQVAAALAVVERAAYGPRTPPWREAASARDELDAYAAGLLGPDGRGAR